MPQTRILLTGATGYIGGSILDALLKHGEKSSFVITAVIRDRAKATKLEHIGVKAVVGSHSDFALVEPLAYDSDIVITAANVDDMDAARAILAGMKRKHAETGTPPILIHTSGTAVLGDKAAGQHSDAPIYSDLDVPLLDSIPATQPHRAIDLAVLSADAEGYVRSWIVIPSTVWGRLTGPLVDDGISNPRSQQIPRLISISAARGKAAMVGKGVNLWPNVEIYELADLYILIFDRARSSFDLVHGREGLYFGSNGEHKLYDLAESVGQTLVTLERLHEPKPTSLSDAEIEKFFGPAPTGPAKANGSYGSNSRARADRGYALGWKPKQSTKEMMYGILDEAKAVLSEGR